MTRFLFLLALSVFFASCGNETPVSADSTPRKDTVASAPPAPKQPAHWVDSSYDHVTIYVAKKGFGRRGMWSGIKAGAEYLFRDLTKEEVLRLDSVLTNTPLLDSVGPASCYEPRHAIYVYDANGKTLAAAEICFQCRRSEISDRPGNQYLPELQKLFESYGCRVFPRSEEHEAYYKDKSKL